MLQGRRPNAKPGFREQHPVGRHLLADFQGTRTAGLDQEAPQYLSVQLEDREARPALADAIPQDPAGQPVDLRSQSRRAIQSADRKLPDPRAQQPEKAGDVVYMRVRDEHVGDLVGDPCRQARSFTKIEQQTASRMAQPYMQQGVAEHAIDQVHAEHADAPDKPRSAGALSRRVRRNIRRRHIGERFCRKGLGRAQGPVRTTGRIPHQQCRPLARRGGEPGADDTVFDGHDLAHGDRAFAVEQRNLPPVPGRRNAAGRRRADDPESVEHETPLDCIGEAGVP